jgi:hypothetical protein
MPATTGMKVTERFTRVSDERIDDEMTIEGVDQRKADQAYPAARPVMTRLRPAAFAS